MSLKLSKYSFLFEDNGTQYLFNSQSLLCVIISNDAYHALMNNDFSFFKENQLHYLIEQKVIIPDNNEDAYFNSQLIKFNSQRFNNEVLYLTIVPTTDCNFDCPYCFESKNNPKYISSKIEQAIYDFIKAEQPKKLSLSWYGGEPLLGFNAIKRIYFNISQIDGIEVLPTSIITNGYLINDDIIEFFKFSKLKHIQITLDGYKDNHNITRYVKDTHTATYNTIVNNIIKLSNSIPELLISIRVNIDKNNYLEYVKVFNFFKSLKLNNVSLYPGIIRHEDNNHKSMCSQSFQNYELLDLYKSFKQKGIKVGLFPHFISKGCMINCLNSYIIGPTGELYKCLNDVGDEKKIVGNILDSKIGNITYLHDCILHSHGFQNNCKHCSVFPICSGGCGNLRIRNLRENANFNLCSPYKDINNLKEAIIYTANQNTTIKYELIL